MKLLVFELAARLRIGSPAKPNPPPLSRAGAAHKGPGAVQASGHRPLGDSTKRRAFLQSRAR